jgi:hypothetical protein
MIARLSNLARVGPRAEPNRTIGRSSSTAAVQLTTKAKRSARKGTGRVLTCRERAIMNTYIERESNGPESYTSAHAV